MMLVTTPSPTTGRHEVLGIIVAGLNEHRKLDEGYLKFVQAVAGQFETALLDGKAREEDRKATAALMQLNQDRIRFFQEHGSRTQATTCPHAWSTRGAGQVLHSSRRSSIDRTAAYSDVLAAVAYDPQRARATSPGELHSPLLIGRSWKTGGEI